jgi:hypothetical protein
VEAVAELTKTMDLVEQEQQVVVMALVFQAVVNLETQIQVQAAELEVQAQVPVVADLLVVLEAKVLLFYKYQLLVIQE